MNVLVYVLFWCVTTAAATPKLKPLSGDVEHVTVEAVQTGYARVKKSVGEGCEFPHALSFQFKVGDDDIVINLEKNVFLSERVPIYITSNGHTRRDEEANGNDFAAYQDLTRHSAMLVSCQDDGNFRLHGSFRHGGVRYHMSHSNTPEPSPIHYIQRDETDKNFNLTNDFVIPPPEAKDEIPGNSNRQKRADIPTGNIVELLFTVDKALYDFFKEDQVTDAATKLAIEQYAALLANEIDLHYCSVEMVDPSLAIKVYLAGVELPEVGSDVSWSSNSQDVWGGVAYIDANTVLPNVRSWISGESNLPQNDHIMALSVIEFAYVSGGTLQTGVAGLAYVGTVCTTTYKGLIANSMDPDETARMLRLIWIHAGRKGTPSESSFTEVDGSRVGIIAAHELGHGLGSYHDESSTCPSSDRNVMSPTIYSTVGLTHAEAQWTFSSCSVAQFKSEIDGLGGNNCMQQHAFTGDDFAALQAKSLPGTVYSLDQQCQMYQGWWSSSCDTTISEDDCYNGFRCASSATLPAGCSSTRTLYPLAGTPCGAPGDNKWCYRGLCTAKSVIATTSTTRSSTTTTTSATSTTSTTTSTTTSSTPTTSSTTSSTPTTSTTTSSTPTTSSTTSSTPTTSTPTSSTPTTSTTTSSTPTTYSTPTTSSTATPTTSSTTRSTPTTTSSTTTPPTTTTSAPTTTSSATTSTPSTTTPIPCNEKKKCCKFVNGKKKCCKGSKCCKSTNSWSNTTPCYSSCCNTVVTTAVTTPIPCNEKKKCCKFVNFFKIKCCKGSNCCKSTNSWSNTTPCYSSCCNTVVTTAATSSPFCSKECCVTKRGRTKCCTGNACCKLGYGRKTNCCKHCNDATS